MILIPEIHILKDKFYRSDEFGMTDSLIPEACYHHSIMPIFSYLPPKDT
jgi:hypothetical protein